MQIRKLAILWNAAKNGAEACAEAVKIEAERLGATTIISDLHPVPDDFLAGTDACCVIGGDGTILGAAQSAGMHGVPIFGINQGKLGYLANYSTENVAQSVEDVFAGRFRRVPHRMLECRLAGDTAETCRLALNDVVIKAIHNFKMIAIRVDAPAHGFVNTYHGDGLIFTTSTGSTAYSLGAEGPLIHSQADVFALNPICPHTLSNRALVLPSHMELEVRNDSPTVPVGISIDGRKPLPGSTAFPIHIRLSDVCLDILQPEGMSEFEILRKKLRWI